MKKYLFSLLVLLWPCLVFGQNATSTQNLSFGSVYLDPSGGIIRELTSGGNIVNIAGTATAVTPGTAGIIRVTGKVGETLEYQIINNIGGSIDISNFQTSPVSTMFFDVPTKDILIGADAIYPYSPPGNYVGNLDFNYRYVGKPVWKTDPLPVSMLVLQIPISITQVDVLNFGNILTSGAGTATIDAGTGAISTTGVATVHGGHQRGQFTVEGEPNTNVTILLPAGSVDLDNVSATQQIQLGSFTSDPSGTVPLDNAGNLTVNIGGTITFGPEDIAGTYSGTYDLTINY